MATVLMLQGFSFGFKKRSQDNKLITVAEVSENQAQQDNCVVVALQREVEEHLVKKAKVKVIYLDMRFEPRSTRCFYENKPESLFINDTVSAHHFTDDEGNITRRLIFMYPMSKTRRGELPRVQLLNKLKKATEGENASKLEVVDLRHFEKDNMVLEGLGAMVFSPNGEFVYMGLSGRSNEKLLDLVCDEEHLNIPKKNRFIFEAVLPHSPEDHGEADQGGVLSHTRLAGWCGKGICAWGFELLRFPTEDKQEEFFQHLEVTYRKIINLSADEIRAFAGSACEVPIPTENGERRVLMISDHAMKSLQRRNLRIIEEWYGHENIFIFYADTLERRAGQSISAFLSQPVTHGNVLPRLGELSAWEVAAVDEKVIPAIRR